MLIVQMLRIAIHSPDRAEPRRCDGVVVRVGSHRNMPNVDVESEFERLQYLLEGLHPHNPLEVHCLHPAVVSSYQVREVSRCVQLKMVVEKDINGERLIDGFPIEEFGPASA